MWIQRFEIFKKGFNPPAELPVLIRTNNEKYDNQKLAFQWIDEYGDKGTEYVLLPIIHFDENEKI